MKKDIRIRQIIRIILLFWIIAEIRITTTNLLNKKPFKYFYKTLRTPKPTVKIMTREYFNKTQKHVPRVLYGHSAYTDQYPFIVSLLDKNKLRQCTGSLIAEQWVLTASHCFSVGLDYVKCGNMRVSWEETDCKSVILDRISYPLYFDNDLRLMDDIGLLRIRDIKGRIGRLHAADGKSFLGRAVRFAGYGMTYRSFEHSPKSIERIEEEDEHRELQTGEGVIFNVDEVLSVAPKCNNKRHSVYFGDSGGPVLVDGKIAGVSSSVTVNVNRRRPETSFFTPVSANLDWILQTMKNYNQSVL